MRLEVDYMLQNGIIEPSQSQWSSPCVLVPKAGGKCRFCTDIWKVNGMTRTGSYPIPWVDDCIDKIDHTKYMTKFELLKGYWQVPLSRHLSAFVTSDGLFQYQVVPFSIKNVPAIFNEGDLRTGWL